MTTCRPLDLASALRVHAAGLPNEEAAVNLLIQHAVWLRREAFVSALIHTTTDPVQTIKLSIVDWPAAIDALDRGDLSCSHSEAHVLRLAASLAAGIPVDLRETLTGLDRPNSTQVCHAVRHTTGHR